MSQFRTIEHQADLCVVGGGMAGVCAALSAARHGARVALITDRPVLGGNSSSECRVNICGADRHNKITNMRETGLLEELRLADLPRNPHMHHPLWDMALYNAVAAEPNIELLLNCSCQSAQMDGNAIVAVTGWQLTTQTFHRVCAKIFADCSGDAILAPLTGAQFRIGREARSEFNESIAPTQSDACTMGMTCLFQARQYDTPQPFEPYAWAHRYDFCDDLPYGVRGHQTWDAGYWWVELGGEHDSIADTEHLRGELLKITLGVWDHIKNRCSRREQAMNWALDWVQFLPGKRESRRYVGLHLLTQNDIEAEGRFDDLVAYGGWWMDDHHPAGFNARRVGGESTIFHHTPSPYGIPYRCLVSRNIRNLMFAGRDASATHAAMSSTRVQGTCAAMGQALGTAAAMAALRGIDPAGVLEHVGELQQALLYDDAYLPWVPQAFSPLTMDAKLTASAGEPEAVRDGTNRPVGDTTHCWSCRAGDWISYTFPAETPIETVTAIVDSSLDQDIALSLRRTVAVSGGSPAAMPRGLHFEGLINGDWQTIARISDNRQRLVRVPVGRAASAVRLTIDSLWGAAESRVYAFYVE